MHRRIKNITASSVPNNNIQSIAIPKDKTLDWNKIPKKMPNDQWEIIIDKHKIVKNFNQRNRKHLNQAQGTTYTIPPISTSLLSNDSFTPFGEAIINGTVDFTNLPLSKVQKQFFKSLKRESPDKRILPAMSISQMKQGFQKWREKTSTSPSKRHLGHYKCLLIPDNNKDDTNISDFNKNMLHIHNVMINSPLSLGAPLNLWTTSKVIMIPKEPNNIQINRLRLINLYEAD